MSGRGRVNVRYTARFDISNAYSRPCGGTVSQSKGMLSGFLLQISHRNPCDQMHGLSHNFEDGGGMHTTYRTLRG